MKDYSVVVPVYNSEDCLRELYKRLSEALVSFELILVNDRSKDKSWDVISSLAESNSNVIGINLRKNAGQDNAIMAGLAYASGKYVVIMDDDLQHAPEDIPLLRGGIDKGFDVCFAQFDGKKQAIWKNIGSWLNGKVSEYLLGKPRHIYLSPFKIMVREVVKEILLYDGPYPYIDGLILGVTDNLTQIPVKHHDRFRGESNYNLIKSARVFIKHATGFSVYPLRIATFLGLMSALFGFLLGAYFILSYLMKGSTVEGWTSVVCIVLFLCGIMLLCIGIIGEYVGRSYLKLNNKLQYTIKDILNVNKLE